MTIAITAAGGHLGRLALAEAVRVESDVIAIVRDPARLGAPPVGVEVRTATYDDRAAMTAALAGVDELLFISGNEVGRRVEQHRNVIDAAVAAGVSRLVYTSAPRDTVIAPEHQATEEYLAASGLSWTVVRDNWYHENYLAEIPQVRETGVLLANAGDGRVASGSRADYAAGAIAVLTGEWRDRARYEFGGDIAWDYHELAATLAELLGRPVRYEAVNAATLVDTLTAAGLPRGAAEFAAAVGEDIAAGRLGEVTGDLGRVLGRPTTPLVDTLRAGLGAS